MQLISWPTLSLCCWAWCSHAVSVMYRRPSPTPSTPDWVTCASHCSRAGHIIRIHAAKAIGPGNKKKRIYSVHNPQCSFAPIYLCGMECLRFRAGKCLICENTNIAYILTTLETPHTVCIHCIIDALWKLHTIPFILSIPQYLTSVTVLTFEVLESG